jgi:hypothetical protein
LSARKWASVENSTINSSSGPSSLPCPNMTGCKLKSINIC